ncbi:organ-specific protein S2-like [Eucalyptus grandis]|uniref:organ-specific protein S2-like n=1 Tax=Eucalyptus grandis TaxID=71139 RepID=UPI00192EA6A1|nr:organ-specific protein S2-like [Eucalyptus grandis]
MEYAHMSHYCSSYGLCRKAWSTVVLSFQDTARNTFIGTAVARTDPGEYWVSIMKEEPMPEAIEGLLHVINPPSDRPHLTSLPEKKEADCHGDDKLEDHKRLIGDFEPRPDVTAYGNDAKLQQKKFTEDIEPRPDVTAYGNDAKLQQKKFAEDFEPRPDVTAYGDDAKLQQKKFAEDFEPRPDVTAYGDDAQLKGRSHS